MPFRPRGRGGRRGRPPKRNGHPPQETTPPIKPTEPNLTSTSAPSYKPREERSFKDFFPDLNVHDALIIQQETTEQPPLHMPMTVALAEQHPLNTDPVPSGAQAATTPTPDLSSLPAHPTVNADDDKVSVPSPSPSVQPDAPVLTTWPTSRPLHPKEGDSHQALSTRPQAHLTSAAGSVNLDTLPKPKFSKVIERPKQRRGSRRSSRHQDDQPAPADPADSPVDDTLQMAVYERPDNHYIRYIEPTEQDLYEMVEYDMDEQDEIWLHLLNVERKADNTGEVPSSLFENVMDKLEKEWFDLVKHLPKHTDDEPVLPEDSTCAICDDGECENSNAIVFCDGCNLAVHQDCYGVPYIPEGQWLCRKCMVSPDKPVSCVFCPNEGGAFKQTNTNKWGHLLCAIWIPEVGVSNSVYMEPIDNIEAVPKSRWRLTCYICRKKHGACIQCDNKHCFTAFHVTCARWARLCMRMKSLGTHYDSVVLKAYCDRHTPREYQDEVDVEKCVVAAQRLLDPKAARNRDRAAAGTLIPRRRHVDEYLQTSAFDDNPNDWVAGDQAAHRKPGRPPRGRPGRPPKRKLHDLQAASSQLPSSSLTPLSPSVKAARAHQHHYSAGAPIAPDVILSRLETTCFRQYSQLRKKPQLLATICRYWSLKRESRRGAPLLKRLHLEPWTASSTQLKQTEVERAHRASAIMTLRSDLERIRLLSEQVQKREKQKLDRIRRQKEYLELILYPLEYIVKPIINDLIDMDKKEYFMYPVTPDVAPDYHQVIDKPMCFTDVINKFHAHQYDTLEAIEMDLDLIWNNSMTYNRSETVYYKLAKRMKEEAKLLLDRARMEFDMLDIAKETGTLAAGIDANIFDYALIETSSSTETRASAASTLSTSSVTTVSSPVMKRKYQKRTSVPSSSPARITRSLAPTAVAEKALPTETEPLEPPRKRLRRSSHAPDMTKEAPAQGRRPSTTKASTTPPDLDTASVSSPATSTSSTTSSSGAQRRHTRSSGSGNLAVPTEEGLKTLKSRKLSQELRKLISPNTLTIPQAYAPGSYKESKTHKSIRGYVYISESESDADGPGDDGPATDDLVTDSANHLPAGHSPASPSSSAPIKRKGRGPRLHFPTPSTSIPVTAKNPGKHPEAKPKKKKKSALRANDVHLNPKLHTTEINQIVWARVIGFPFHPAKIVDIKDGNVPNAILKAKHNPNAVLVEFFKVPQNHRWGWIRRGHLYKIGDAEMDAQILHSVKLTKPNKLEEVCEGYLHACKLLDIPPQQF